MGNTTCCCKEAPSSHVIVVPKKAVLPNVGWTPSIDAPESTKSSPFQHRPSPTKSSPFQHLENSLAENPDNTSVALETKAIFKKDEDKLAKTIVEMPKEQFFGSSTTCCFMDGEGSSGQVAVDPTQRKALPTVGWTLHIDAPEVTPEATRSSPTQPSFLENGLAGNAENTFVVQLKEGGCAHRTGLDGKWILETKAMAKKYDDKLAKIIAQMPKDQLSQLVIMPVVEGGAGVVACAGLVPQAGNDVHASLHKHFPGALPGPSVHFRSQKVLAEKFRLTGDNTLLGSSVCPDEINNLEFGLISLMFKHWGEVFEMGGLGGAPHVGKTGFKAFSSHVPDNGNILVVFGPHVGLSPKGEVGKYLRDGQGKESSACGAAIGAYNFCALMEKPVEAVKEVDPADFQMSWTKQQLAPHVKEILASEAPMAMLAFKSFDIVNDTIQDIVNTKFGSGYLVLLGGIQINMPAPYCEHFLPLIFEARQEGKETIDLMPDLRLPGMESGV